MLPATEKAIHEECGSIFFYLRVRLVDENETRQNVRRCESRVLLEHLVLISFATRRLFAYVRASFERNLEVIVMVSF